MRTGKYIRSSLTHYWRTNLAVVMGVAVTVAVLTGALLVGDSVRVSLRNLFLLRLGQTSYVIAAGSLFPEDLAERLQHHSDFPASLDATAPLITLEGLVTHEKSGRRGSNIQVYGVDDRFWQFHGRPGRSDTLRGRTLLVSASLAEEFAAAPGDTLLVRVQKPSDVPADSLHGRKDDLGRSMRFTVGGILSAQELGEFSLRPTQGAVRAVFLPLQQLQRDLQQEAKVNAVIVSAKGPAESENEAEQLAAALQSAATLEDYGLQISPLDGGRGFSLLSEKLLIEDPLAEAARTVAKNQGLAATAHYSYLATTIRAGKREIPYSLVTAIDPVPDYFSFSPGENTQLPPLWLNQWAASDLRARPGMVVELEYYVWEDGGHLLTETAQFELRGIISMRGFAIDKDLAPDYPGITDADTVGDWDPPFPIDLQRVRPKDEAYWNRYRAAPKAFVPLRAGQDLWRSRYGQITGIRFTPPENAPLPEAMAVYQKSLREALRPEQAGFTIYPARAEGTTASRGAVNFGEYFFYFSFFLVVSALLITGLFFKLGVEQRLREIGLLQAVGFPRKQVARLFLIEGFLLSLLGSVVGLAGAISYSGLMMYGLRTWWVDAVGTTFLTLQVSLTTLALGGIAGVFAALLTIAWTLRSLRPLSTRNLLAGSLQPLLTAASHATRTTTVKLLGLSSALLALALLVASWAGWLNQVAGFFGSGTLLLISLMSFLFGWLSGRQHKLLTGKGYAGLARLGFRNASWRPGRSLLCIALIASSTFIVVAVDSFRHNDSAPSLDPASGTGGYPLLAETLLPLAFDPNTPEGKEQLNLSDNDLGLLRDVRFTSFRLRPGEDTSCLNLYQPRDPKVLAVPPAFHQSPRFAFQSSLAETPEERKNPWRLLEREFPDGAIPAIADANSMTYILHLGLGEDFVLTRHSGEQVRFRMVAALADSIFQSELLISQENFLQVFPHEQGFRFFLLETPLETAGQVTEILEAGLSDSGFDITTTGERLATFHRVENTYLSTFQALGGLGLLLGTVGLAAVLLRNVLERRRELALLRAVGFRPADLAFLVLAENALLLAGGLVSGVVSALLAIAPALLSRGGFPPVLSLGGLLLAVLVTGLAASLLAVRVVLRAPLLPVLRTE